MKPGALVFALAIQRWPGPPRPGPGAAHAPKRQPTKGTCMPPAQGDIAQSTNLIAARPT